MVYYYNELLESGLNRYQIEKKVSNGELYKIEKGIYSNEKFPSELSVIDLVLSDNMFIQNLSNNNNWTGQSILNILETIKKYVAEL